MCSDSPDMRGVNAAAQANAEIGKEALDWYKQVYEDSAPDRAATSAAARRVSAVQEQLGLQSLETARKASERYDTKFAPVEDSIVADAMAYDTPARREAEAGQAMADVDTQLASQREVGMRELAARGVDPSSGSAAMALSRAGVSGAAIKAAAGNTARQRVETVGAAKKMDAAGIGRGVVSNQGTQAQIGLQSGNSAVQNANMPNTVTQQGASLMGQGFQSGAQHNATAGSLYANAANGGATDNSAIWSTVGTVAGAALAAWSDENMKEDIAPAEGEIALAAVRKMPVKRWKYKPGSPGDDGGKQHVGPMAQSVNAALGEDAAPGGKQVDLISLAGTSLAAVKALDKRVLKLENARRRHA